MTSERLPFNAILSRALQNQYSHPRRLIFFWGLWALCCDYLSPLVVGMLFYVFSSYSSCAFFSDVFKVLHMCVSPFLNQILHTSLSLLSTYSGSLSSWHVHVWQSSHVLGNLYFLWVFLENLLQMYAFFSDGILKSKKVVFLALIFHCMSPLPSTWPIVPATPTWPGSSTTHGSSARVLPRTWGKGQGLSHELGMGQPSQTLGPDSTLLMLLSSTIFSVILLNIYHLIGHFTCELSSDVAGNLGHSSKNVWNTLCLFNCRTKISSLLEIQVPFKWCS